MKGVTGLKYYNNSNYPMNCGCNMGPGFGRGTGPMMNGMRRIIDSEYPLAMAYVPWQTWGETYAAETALCKGTLFPELDLPFTGCQRRNCCG